MKTTLRTVRPNDIPAIVGLIREFAEFEDLSSYCEVTEDRLMTALFGESAVVEGLIAFEADRPIGYALFFPNFSSFRGQRGFYLDDIYLNEKYRGHGIGRAMLKKVASLAAERGFERIDLLVLDWNTKAVDFYLSLGAVHNLEEKHFKFTDNAFQELAA